MTRSWHRCLLSVVMAAIWSSSVLAASKPKNYYTQGEALYQAGRLSEAMEAFDEAIARKDRAPEAQAFIERIRKETVERIRNKALTGINKSTWQSKYYFMNELDGRLNVGISIQELFERDSIHFRPGAIEALNQLAAALGKADNRVVRVEVINERSQDQPAEKSALVQQLSAVYSYLSLAARGQEPRF